jgi:hypothetical protein
VGKQATETGSAMVLTEDEALEILTFLLCAADISLVEPTHYPIFRLIDGASRLMGLMLAHDPPRSGDFLRAFKAEIDERKVTMMWDMDAFEAFVREAPGKISAEVKRLHDAGTEASE